MPITITDITVRDLRFPASQTLDGSDAVNVGQEYSATYVVLHYAGGVGLCEHVQHLSLFDDVAVSVSLENRIAEYVDHLHGHFVYPVVVRNDRYMPPLNPGYSVKMKPASLNNHEFPSGQAWQK